MLVFIDESGCAGRIGTHDGDPVFGMGMVIFATGEDARVTESCVGALHTKLRHPAEFKFSKCRDVIRDAFFRGVVAQPFRVRALLVRKEQRQARRMQSHAEVFYSYFVKQLMKGDGACLQKARVRIDGSGDRAFRRALGVYLRRELGDRVRDVKTTDSARDQLTQLADMCIGAIVRTQRRRGDAMRWAEMLRPRIDDISHLG